MAKVRQYAIDKLEEQFPGKGFSIENIIYEDTKETLRETGTNGMDFYPFRYFYKNKIQSLLQNLSREDSNIKNTLMKIIKEDEDVDEKLKGILTLAPKEWEQELWGLDTDDDIHEEEDSGELREGAFDCGNCARKGMYSRNTSHYEKQTRSADEPMTVFMHCHTCGKDYRFSS